jgi:class 3 adenylate cyclase
MDETSRVLVVDDDAEVRDMLVEYLTGQGFAVSAAEDAPGMWAHLVANPVDLILLDRTMPTGDSVEELPKLRRETRAGVLLVTALSADAERIRGLDDGADDYITKPFVWGELTARMRAVLRRTAARRELSSATAGHTPPETAQPVPAAVLCADIAGFVRLMQNDEAVTLRTWWSDRGIVIEPMIADHGGRIVKYTGDGFLAEFAQPQAAVACAVAIQRGIAARRGPQPESRRLRYRMGVHCGPIVREADDIFGTTVNLAARLQILAPVGGIAVSTEVSAAASTLANVAFVDAGAHTLRHFDEPVQLWMVKAPGCALPSELQVARRRAAG